MAKYLRFQGGNVMVMEVAISPDAMAEHEFKSMTMIGRRRWWCWSDIRLTREMGLDNKDA